MKNFDRILTGTEEVIKTFVTLVSLILWTLKDEFSKNGCAPVAWKKKKKIKQKKNNNKNKKQNMKKELIYNKLVWKEKEKDS